MANYIYIATSLDGFIADKDGGLDWLNEMPNPNNDDFGFFEFVSGVDAIVMGKNTFQMVLSFDVEWPYPIPVFVLSNTLKEIPKDLEGKVEIVSGEPADVVNLLKGKGYTDLYIDGGKVIQSFLSEGLIDQMVISKVPVLLGNGISLFGNSGSMQKFEHLQTVSYENGMVKSHYIKIDK